jgi:hypothetical protein
MAPTTTTTAPKPNIAVTAAFTAVGVGKPLQFTATYAAGPVAVDNASIAVALSGTWPNYAEVLPSTGSSLTCSAYAHIPSGAVITCSGNVKAGESGTLSITTGSSITAAMVGKTVSAVVTPTPGVAVPATGTYK